METENKKLGRPAVKPKRKPSTILINCNLIDKIQLLQNERLKKGIECSIPDIHNEALIKLLRKEGI
jgi:hypothetical protein